MAAPARSSTAGWPRRWRPRRRSRREIAAHWLAARDRPARSTRCWRRSAAAAAVHAYRDAARLGRQALELWPEGERAARAHRVVEDYAVHAELAGDLGEAARAQREVVAARRAAGAGRALADAERRIAGIYALQGDRARALAARRVAAEAYAVNGLPGEAAAERLVIAGYLLSAGGTSRRRRSRPARGPRPCAQTAWAYAPARMGLQGVATVKAGELRGGRGDRPRRPGAGAGARADRRDRRGLPAPGHRHEIAGDYTGARDALGTALGLCENSGADALQQVCLSCMAYVLRELGDWAQVDRVVAGPDHRRRRPATRSSPTASSERCTCAAGRDAALPLLTRCLETAAPQRRVDALRQRLGARVARRLRGRRRPRRAVRQMLLDRWEQSEDHHYAVWGLRWACGWLADRGRLELARACTIALSSIAGSSGYPDALAALACALGDTAVADEDAETAADQLLRAVDIHHGLAIPYDGRTSSTAPAVRSSLPRRKRRWHSSPRRTGAPGRSVRRRLPRLPPRRSRRSGVSLEAHLGARAADDHARAST